MAELGGEPPWIEQISWKPRAQVYHNFLTPQVRSFRDLGGPHRGRGGCETRPGNTDGASPSPVASCAALTAGRAAHPVFPLSQECDHLINLAAPHMTKSSVVDRVTGKSMASKVRTSTGHFLRRNEDPIVTRIEERIAAFSMVPADHGEGMQVLHYTAGQKYEPHYDYFQDPVNVKGVGQRVATVLMYLSDVEEGGETVFPKGTFVHGDEGTPSYDHQRELSNRPGTSKCALGKLHVKPRRGDALLFWSTSLNGHEDEASLHGGCPVGRGDKWTATKWIRVGPGRDSEKEREVKERIQKEREERVRRGEDIDPDEW